MKMTSTILFDFIHDFKLEDTEVGVCFDAVVDFNLPTQNFNLRSEVHLQSVLSNRIDTIYLLNPAIKMYRMPTFFNDVSHRFLYPKYKGVIIVGKMPLMGAYTISIFPKSQTCTKKTFDELRAKKFN